MLKLHLLIFICFRALFFNYDHIVYYFMAPYLVIKHLTTNRVYNVLLYRLAASCTIFSVRTLLQHIKTINELSIKVVLTLSC